MCPRPQSVGLFALSGRSCSKWQRQLVPVAAPLLGGRGDANAICQQKYLSQRCVAMTLVTSPDITLLTQAAWAGAGLVAGSPGSALDGDSSQQLLEQGTWGRNPHLQPLTG